MRNYEQEFDKMETVSQMLISMITDYKDKLQKRLTDSMVKQRNLVNVHMKDIREKKQKIREVLTGVEVVEKEVESIKENE